MIAIVRTREQRVARLVQIQCLRATAAIVWIATASTTVNANGGASAATPAGATRTIPTATTRAATATAAVAARIVIAIVDRRRLARIHAAGRADTTARIAAAAAAATETTGGSIRTVLTVFRGVVLVVIGRRTVHGGAQCDTRRGR